VSLIIRFSVDGQAPCWGLLMANEQVQPLSREPFEELRPYGSERALSEVQLLAPVLPSKIVAMASNYHAHIEEMGRPVPSVPKIFMKPPSSVIGPGEPIQIPPFTQRVDHEAELGVVIGRRMCRVPGAEAMAYVFGYTCVNDITARDLQRSDGVFTRAKGFDSFCPIGPWIQTDLEPGDLAVKGWVDDELRQDGRSSDLIFDLPTMLSFISSVMTLMPGDVVSTGTPAGVGPIQHGQTVTVEVEGIGRLVNPVVDRSDRRAPPYA
jgi:2-keto-4-pentenoate hydratase/2-oxohepta-3-ene-1,7-dioic acid hydratase in catechol pathway